MPTYYSDLFGLHYFASCKTCPQATSSISIFIHGVGGTYRHWQPVINSLSQHTFAIAIDLPGHGSSPGFVPEEITTVVDSIHAFIKSLEISQPINLIGHSLGGQIALAYCIKYSKHVARLGLISSAELMRLHPDLIDQIKQSKPDVDFWRQGLSSGMDSGLQHMVLNDFCLLRVDPLAKDFLGVIDLCPIGDLSTITQPVLIIYGDEDKIVSPRRIRSLANTLNNASLVKLNGVAHYPHLEMPLKVSELLKEYLFTQ